MWRLGILEGITIAGDHIIRFGLGLARDLARDWRFEQKFEGFCWLGVDGM
jgi:hypothetical protein